MDEQRFRDAVECNRDMVFRVAYTYLRNWLVRVTVNECRSLFRRPWRRVEDIEAYANQLQMPSEGHVRVFTAVMRLPERYRVPLVLHYYGGFSTGGVAYAVATSGFFQRVFGDHGLGERSEWGFTTSSGEAYGFTREFSDAASEDVVEDLEAAVEEVREFVLTPTA